MSLLQWLHSGGAFNKEPENDLGNYPSQFNISGALIEPTIQYNVMNNLFRDVMPEETAAGMTDFRCFYLWNFDTSTAVKFISLSLDQCTACGSYIQYGSNWQNDVQTITISCMGFESVPDNDGFVIFQCEFGPPFTIYYTTVGGFSQFASDLQSAFNLLPWCEGVTVSGTNPFIVTFAGQAGNRNVQLIRVIQNDLLIKGISRLDTVTYYASDPWNGFGDMQVKTVEPISNYVPQSGTINIYNPLTGLWNLYPYRDIVDSTGDSRPIDATTPYYIFQLSETLEFNLVGFLGMNPAGPNYGNVDDPENWQRAKTSPETDTNLPVPWGVIEVPLQDKNCCVSVGKTTQGSPINTIAAPIPTPYIPPVSTFTVSALPPTDVLNLRPNEGFFIWVQRMTPPSATPCLRDYFTINIVANQVIWPLDSGGV